MMGNIILFWKETWQQNKILFVAEMIGTLCGMSAATIIGFQSPDPDLPIVFTLYNINAILFIYSSYVRKCAWLILLMSFYIMTNTVGLWLAL